MQAELNRIAAGAPEQSVQQGDSQRKEELMTVGGIVVHQPKRMW